MQATENINWGEEQDNDVLFSFFVIIVDETDEKDGQVDILPGLQKQIVITNRNYLKKNDDC